MTIKVKDLEEIMYDKLNDLDETLRGLSDDLGLFDEHLDRLQDGVVQIQLSVLQGTEPPTIDPQMEEARKDYTKLCDSIGVAVAEMQDAQDAVTRHCDYLPTHEQLEDAQRLIDMLIEFIVAHHGSDWDRDISALGVWNMKQLRLLVDATAA